MTPASLRQSRPGSRLIPAPTPRRRDASHAKGASYYLQFFEVAVYLGNAVNGCNIDAHIAAVLSAKEAVTASRAEPYYLGRYRGRSPETARHRGQPTLRCRR